MGGAGWAVLVPPLLSGFVKCSPGVCSNSGSEEPYLAIASAWQGFRGREAASHIVVGKWHQGTHV